tara:strand:- start:13800 stop:14603 length:804 start_codon:yes stop_codon:yes gene_type:complete
LRIALGLEYDGTNFFGWQAQKNNRSVQSVLEDSISLVADRRVKVSGSGRTDTGVHSIGQVVHFDTDSIRTNRGWRLGINSNLPEDISVLWVREIDNDFDSRRSALDRSYRYIIHESETRSALLRNRAWTINKKLDVSAMLVAASYLLGENDFSSFRASSCESISPMRNMFSISFTKDTNYLSIEFRANAFLQHMVRNIVGSLVNVGTGKADTKWFYDLLLSQDRKMGSMAAPPQGLFLLKIRYPKKYNLPSGYVSNFNNFQNINYLF